MLTCRRLADEFQRAYKREDEAVVASYTARTAKLAFEQHKVQLDKDYVAKKADLEMDLNSKKCVLTTQRTQLVSHMSAVLT